MTKEIAEFWTDAIWHLLDLPFVAVRFGDCSVPVVTHNVTQTMPPSAGSVRKAGMGEPIPTITVRTDVAVIETIIAPGIVINEGGFSILINQRERNTSFVLRVNPHDMSREIVEFWRRAKERQYNDTPLNILKP